MAQLGEQERCSTARPRRVGALLLRAAAVLLVLAGSAWLLARHDRAPASVVERVAPPATQLAWARALSRSGAAERALRLEAEHLRQDSRTLLRRLAACARIGPADSKG
ncbi:MAG: hypothetical protein HZA53_00210 [Planctomycetes bacterium]|nr:hypothetical protein [Planctomycetota bacterium]